MDDLLELTLLETIGATEGLVSNSTRTIAQRFHHAKNRVARIFQLRELTESEYTAFTKSTYPDVLTWIKQGGPVPSLVLPVPIGMQGTYVAELKKAVHDYESFDISNRFRFLLKRADSIIAALRSNAQAAVVSELALTVHREPRYMDEDALQKLYDEYTQRHVGSGIPRRADHLFPHRDDLTTFHRLARQATDLVDNGVHDLTKSHIEHNLSIIADVVEEKEGTLHTSTLQWLYRYAAVVTRTFMCAALLTNEISRIVSVGLRAETILIKK